jgi:hypothetical protein
MADAGFLQFLAYFAKLPPSERPSALENIVTASSQRLEDVGNTNGVTSFMRVEDGAWDPTHPNDFYFVTTASATQPSRMWRPPGSPPAWPPWRCGRPIGR